MGALRAGRKAADVAPRARRRRNPARDSSSSARVEDALDFYKAFHWGDDSDQVVRRKVSRPPRVGVRLGEVHAITYGTTKGGETALWEHEFGEEGGDKPDLVMDAENKRLHIVGGSYDVRPEGIVD